METIWNAERFSEARKATGVTVKDAADALEIVPEYLSMIENGKKHPSSKLIAKMCTLYGQVAAFFLQDDQRFAKT